MTERDWGGDNSVKCPVNNLSSSSSPYPTASLSVKETLTEQVVFSLWLSAINTNCHGLRHGRDCVHESVSVRLCSEIP